jgi:hypothetical protein
MAVFFMPEYGIGFHSLLLQVTFATKIFHPNVDGENGSICVAALKDAEWRPTTQMVDGTLESHFCPHLTQAFDMVL